MTKSKLKHAEEHFDTGLKLSSGWKIGRFPSLGNERIGEPQNSTSQIIVTKGDSRIKMNQIDGRLGGGYRLTIDRNTSRGYDRIDFKVKKYDEALDNIHSLMRMIK